jgi:hypothetical protein
MQYIIWSNEHKAYWRPNAAGYTKAKSQAGRYSLADAIAICDDANLNRDDNQAPQETMLAVREAA